MMPFHLWNDTNANAIVTGGVEVVCWTLDRTIRVRFPAYPHRVWSLWWQGGKRRLRTSRCPCRGRLGTLKTPSCPWRWVPGSNLETGHPPRHSIAEISLNVTLNHNQPTNQWNCDLDVDLRDKNSFFYLLSLEKCNFTHTSCLVLQIIAIALCSTIPV